MYTIQHPKSKVFLTDEGHWKVAQQCKYPILFNSEIEVEAFCQASKIDGEPFQVVKVLNEEEEQLFAPQYGGDNGLDTDAEEVLLCFMGDCGRSLLISRKFIVYSF